jgi:hypothetical protein
MLMFSEQHTYDHEGKRYRNTAEALFEKALWRGRLYRTFARLWRRPVQLCANLLLTQGRERVQLVPLDRIQGTLGRADDFDAHFYPMHKFAAERWIHIAMLMLAGEALPPVRLVASGDIYYVIDGHHRISVARMLGAAEVDAVVV